MFLETLNCHSREVIITGDFNFHVDNIDGNPDARKFINLLEVHGFKQFVADSTHSAGHTLDLLILCESSTLLRKPVTVVDPCLVDSKGNNVGDHYAVIVTLNIRKPSHERKLVQFRLLSTIDLNEFKSDIRYALDSVRSQTMAENLLEHYNSTCRIIMDKHASVITKIIPVRPNTSWYTNQIGIAKSARGRLERKWRKTKLEIHKEIYKKQCTIVGKLILDAKKNYYNKQLTDAPRDRKHLFANAAAYTVSKQARHIKGMSTCLTLPTLSMSTSSLKLPF